MLIRNIRVTRQTNIAVASEVTLEITGTGPNPLLADDTEGGIMPVTILVSFDAGDTEKVVPIPVVAGFTAIEKTCSARLVDPAPAATLPASASASVGYVPAGPSALYIGPHYADPYYSR